MSAEPAVTVISRSEERIVVVTASVADAPPLVAAPYIHPFRPTDIAVTYQIASAGNGYRLAAWAQVNGRKINEGGITGKQPRVAHYTLHDIHRAPQWVRDFVAEHSPDLPAATAESEV